MLPLLGADIVRRMLKAAMLLVTLSAPLTLTPAASAHNSLNTNVPLSISTAADQGGSGPLAASDMDAGPTTYIQSAAWHPADAAESCPNEPGRSHSGHSGCCASVVCCVTSCVSACGAMSPPADPMNCLSGEMASPSSTTLLSDGIDTIPTDPPPRLSV